MSFQNHFGGTGPLRKGKAYLIEHSLPSPPYTGISPLPAEKYKNVKEVTIRYTINGNIDTLQTMSVDNDVNVFIEKFLKFKQEFPDAQIVQDEYLSQDEKTDLIDTDPKYTGKLQAGMLSKSLRNNRQFLDNLLEVQKACSVATTWGAKPEK